LTHIYLVIQDQAADSIRTKHPFGLFYGFKIRARKIVLLSPVMRQDGVGFHVLADTGNYIRSLVGIPFVRLHFGVGNQP
jgi:hypothetical protein